MRGHYEDRFKKTYNANSPDINENPCGHDEESHQEDLCKSNQDDQIKPQKLLKRPHALTPSISIAKKKKPSSFTSSSFQKLQSFLSAKSKIIPRLEMDKILKLLFDQDISIWLNHWTPKILKDANITNQTKSSFLYTSLLNSLKPNIKVKHDYSVAIKITRLAAKHGHKNFFMVNPYDEYGTLNQQNVKKGKYLNIYLFSENLSRLERNG